MNLRLNNFASAEVENAYLNECQMHCEQIENSCDNKCRVKMSVMRFISSKEQLIYAYSCVIKCKVETRQLLGAKATCSGKFVDCTMFGGYDPIDPCRQTCIIPRIDEEVHGGELDNGITAADTPYTDITTLTKQLVYHGRLIDVNCQYNQLNKVECVDVTGKVLQLIDKITVEDKFKTHSRAPNGAYWKFDCNWIQKLTY